MANNRVGYGINILLLECYLVSFIISFGLLYHKVLKHNGSDALASPLHFIAVSFFGEAKATLPIVFYIQPFRK
jgi:hypothetical protein